jgi:RNA polymerase sigma-70 factor (ECF subfamily)
MRLQTTTRGAPTLRTLWAGLGYWVRALLLPGHNGPATAGADDRPSGDWVGVVAGDGVLRLGLGDLQGKGNGAATYHDYLDRQLHALRDVPPVDFLAGVHGGWPGPRFASLLLLDVDLGRHRFTSAHAGHPDALLRRADGSVSPVPGRRFGLLGVDVAADTTRLLEQEFAPGAAVVLVSDGVLDAGVSRGTPFGVARLVQALREAPSPAAILDAVQWRVERHLDGRPAEDDWSVVVVSRCGCGTGACCRGNRDAAAEPADPWTLLLLRAQAGDAAALAQFVAEATPVLVGRWRRLLGNRDDARDVAHDVLVQVLERLASFDPRRGSAPAWVHGIARYRVIDRQRRRQRLRFVGLAGRDVEADADRTSPLAAASAGEEHEALRRALARLEPRRREAVALFYVYGRSLAEVAERLRVPLATAGTLLHRARAELRASLGPRLGRAGTSGHRKVRRGRGTGRAA